MRYAVGFSAIPDGYRAGEDVARQVAKNAPDVLLMFCSDHYREQLGELAAAAKDVLGEEVLCCGCTGDGVYWSGGVANFGVVALAISSDGRARWACTLERGLGPASAATARRAAADVQDQLGCSPALSLVFADGCRCDGTSLVEGLREILRGPCFGGLAADDRKFARTAVFLGEEEAQDALIVLGAAGEIPTGVSAASGWCPVGETGTVTAASGTKVQRVGERTANAFVRDQIGKAVRPLDLGIVPFAEYPNDVQERFVLRTPSSVDETTGAMELFGRIQEGAVVRACRATMEDIVGGVSQALDEADRANLKPAAAIVISCAGRRWLLTGAGSEEVERVRHRLGDIPFIGLPSFGEIGPFRLPDGSYSPLQFHNVTFVACLLGS